jgi:predicted O-methyltransferase YrrM
MTGFEEAWRDLVREWYPGDPFQPTPAIKQYYETKYRVVERLHPKHILETGVRAGYSAFIFLRAAPQAQYLGLDNGLADVESGLALLDHARLLLKDFDAQLWVTHSQCLHAWPKAKDGAFYEFVHVDAEHSYDGCLHDLVLSDEGARLILVDDYDTGPEVRRACEDFTKGPRRGRWRAEHIPDGGVAGNMLFLRAG